MLWRWAGTREKWRPMECHLYKYLKRKCSLKPRFRTSVNRKIICACAMLILAFLVFVKIRWASNFVINGSLSKMLRWQFLLTLARDRTLLNLKIQALGLLLNFFDRTHWASTYLMLAGTNRCKNPAYLNRGTDTWKGIRKKCTLHVKPLFVT